ncbi:MAG: dTDP-Rha--alpha-D-GlcNAc-pyrophosphate polyprenol alpha-3-L-rhamnosyltransferase [Flavobacteriaceae bacterium]|nr:MAG: dTDP-Rha--alpha-D-GlcNAc-pyrophosphate polyprenol alpha-3-L-rhamnosyltransferase [Flavobacteriaceae bacterium]
MNIAIVILNWNGKQLLEKFLPSIVKYSDPAYSTIYVADNASTDESITFIKKHYPTISIIQNSSNGGYAKGYNDALPFVKEEIYALVNSDIEVSENWLVPILEMYLSRKEIAIIQPKILDFKQKELFEYAGAGGGFIDKYGYPFCRGRVFSSIEKDQGQYNDILPIFWASGACFFITNEVFHQLGGFDEDYFAHQEEIDLCWRAQNLGLSIYYNGQSTVYHVGGATLNELNPQKTYLNFRNSLCNLVKNTPKKGMLLLIFTRLVLDGIAGVKFMMELKPRHTFAIIRAHFGFYTMLSSMLKKRHATNQKTNYYLTKSIVWDYFVKGKKRLDMRD